MLDNTKKYQERKGKKKNANAKHRTRQKMQRLRGKKCNVKKHN